MMDEFTIGAIFGALVTVFVAAVVFIPPTDKELRYEEVIAACEEYQPRHIQCEIFAAPVQKVFAPATQTNAAPQQGDRS